LGATFCSHPLSSNPFFFLRQNGHDPTGHQFLCTLSSVRPLGHWKPVSLLLFPKGLLLSPHRSKLQVFFFSTPSRYSTLENPSFLLAPRVFVCFSFSTVDLTFSFTHASLVITSHWNRRSLILTVQLFYLKGTYIFTPLVGFLRPSLHSSSLPFSSSTLQPPIFASNHLKVRRTLFLSVMN